MKEAVLGLGFHGEGRTDARFLLPLVERVTTEVLAAEARYTIRVDTPLDLTARKNSSRAEELLAGVRGAIDQIDLLFLHADGSGDPAGARASVLQPLIDGLKDQHGAATPVIVRVVPVREMEAWMLSDPDAIADVLGARRTSRELGLPTRARDVEAVPDPKELLNLAVQNARSRTRRRRTRIPYEPLAESIRLDRLRSVPAFAELETELRDALRELGHLAG